MLQLKKQVFESRHKEFVSPDGPGAPTHFEFPPIADLMGSVSTVVTYESTNKKLHSNHPGRNSFPENLRREERIINPTWLDITLVRRISEVVTETLANTPT